VLKAAGGRRICALWLLAAGVTPLAAQKWQIQYFYDHAKSSFAISDLQFPSATRGVAVGVITQGKREDPTSVVTSDGGQHWQTVALHEPPISLFFLNENLGWLVTTKGLWKTVEAGRTWTKLPRLPSEIYRVYFLDENHGWAVGPKKTALETNDGGKTWTPLGFAAADYGEDVKYSAYTLIAFATPKMGLITGWNIPPSMNDWQLPDWVDPETALRQRSRPHLAFTVSTSDAGNRWIPSSKSLFGTISHIRFAPNGTGLELMQYGAASRYPSEVYSFDWPIGAAHSVYRDAKFAVSDIWLATDGTAYLAGTRVRGQMRNVIPEAMQVLTSKDLKNWTPIPVDYRAQGLTAILAASDDGHLWMATDTGMILVLAH
jgi:photosystem II stability/assembly factor-like uncharacterized protein